MACRSLATLGDLWLLVSDEHRLGVEKAQSEGLVPANMHFTFVGQHRPASENRLVARGQSWLRYMAFTKAIFPIAREASRKSPIRSFASCHLLDVAHRVAALAARCPFHLGTDKRNRRVSVIALWTYAQPFRVRL